MKKLKLMILCMLALPLVTNIKASSCATLHKASTAVTAKAQQVNAPASLMEQIFFPHGI